MAKRSSGRPAAGVYRWLRGSAAAVIAAATIGSGVEKSGSPAPKPITGRPAALSALAFASTASVADSAIPLIRAEIREWMTVFATLRGPWDAIAAIVSDRSEAAQGWLRRIFTLP